MRLICPCCVYSGAILVAISVLGCDDIQSSPTSVEIRETVEARVESESRDIQGHWEQNASDEQFRIDHHPEKSATPTRVVSGFRLTVEGNVIHLQAPHYVVDGTVEAESPPPIAVQKFTLTTADRGETFTIVMRPRNSEIHLKYRREGNTMTLLAQDTFVLHRADERATRP